jgi:putative lipoic acid-binding regulatory protein
MSVKERGNQRRSISLSFHVTNCASLTALRRALKDDERVQMVF